MCTCVLVPVMGFDNCKNLVFAVQQEPSFINNQACADPSLIHDLELVKN